MDKNYKYLILFLLPCLTPAQLNWQYRYNGPFNQDEGAYSIACGSNGNVYVTGSQQVNQSTKMVALSLNSGDTNWVYRDSVCRAGRSVCYGGDNNIYIAGYQGATLISLSSSGTLNWTFPDTLAAEYIYANAVLYADSTVFAAGSYNGWYTVMSLHPSGDTNWVRTLVYGGEAYGIELGPDSNLYAFGIGNAQAMVASITRDGDTKWIGCHPGYYGHFRDIVCDNNGNVYAAGWYYEYLETTNLIVVSFDSLGDTNWVYLYDSNHNTPYDYDEATSVVMGSDSNLYVTGMTTQPDGSGIMIVISLDRLGNQRWIRAYPGRIEWYWWPYEGKQTVNGPDNHIYIGSCSGEGYFQIIKIDTLGNTIWRYLNNGTGNRSDYAQSLTFGSDNNLYVAGHSDDIVSYYDILVVSIGPQGEVFESGSAGAVQVVDRLHACPNPFYSYARIIGHERERFVLYDVTGRILRYYYGNLIGFDLPPGIYFIRSADQDCKPVKIIKLK